MFKSWASQIGHSVANSLPPPWHFFKRSVLPGRNDAATGPQTRSTLWRNTPNIIKHLI